MPDVSLNGIEFEIKGSTDAASSSIDKLIGKLSALNDAMSKGNGLSKLKSNLTGLKKALDEIKSTDIKGAVKNLEQLGKLGNSLQGLANISKDVASFMRALSKLAENPENVLDLAQALNILGSVDLTNLQNAEGALRALADSLSAAGKKNTAAKAVRDVGREAKKANTPLKNFLASIKRIAFYRILRGILKSISQGFQEGLKNAYQYSKMTGGALAQALDTVATKSLTMKNQLGAAFGTLLQAITPAIVGAIKLITALAAAITRLIAIISGHGTWLKAKDVWTDWGDAAAGAGGKAKEALRYLAPFDELNRLPDENKGGGGGGDSSPWGDMFETVSTDEDSGFLKTLTEAFKSIGDWFEGKDWQDIGKKAWEGLKKAFSSEEEGAEAIRALLEALGAGVGALVGFSWGFLSDLAKDIIVEFAKNIKDYNGDGKLTMYELFLAAIDTNGSIKTKIVTWCYDNLIKPFLDGFGKALTGDKTFDFQVWWNKNIAPWFTKEKWQGIAQKAMDWLRGKLKIGEHFLGLKTWWDAKVKPWFTKTKWEGLGKNAMDWLRGKLKIGEHFLGFKVWWNDKVKPWFTKDKWQTVAKNAIGWLKEKLKIGSPGLGFATWWKEKIKPWFTKEKWQTIASNAMSWLKGALTIGNYNPIKTWWDDKVAPWFTAEKWKELGKKAIEGIKSGLSSLTLPKFSLTWESAEKTFSVLGKEITMKIPWPKLSFAARGGIVDAATLFGNGLVAGEAGAEAIVPLERHTEWMDGVAERMLRAIARISPTVIAPAAAATADGSLSEEAMYRAFSRALADSDLGGDIELDGDVLYRRMVNRNRQNTRLTGVNAMA